MHKKNIGITWQLSEYFGWGIFGLNIVKNMIKSDRIRPELLYLGGHELSKKAIDPIREVINSASLRLPEYQKIIANKKQLLIKNIDVLHAFGNDFTSAYELPPIIGNRNFGFIFYEQTNFSTKGMQRGRSLNAILAGSSWNAKQLKSIGFENTFFVMQGVDKEKFFPLPKEKYKDKFVIFSGGKLEFRKGQDIVLTAFKEFNKKHPDSLLITCWGNKWPTISADMANSPHKVTLPKIVGNKIDINFWSQENGLPIDACIHHEFIPNHDLNDLYRNIDVGLFPNRAEGGTNLVAMELMCAGVPCVISNNTGHQDIITNDNSYVLNSQKFYTNSNMSGWGESSVEEIIEQLEIAYSDTQKRKDLGNNARKYISLFSWQNQTQQLTNVIESYV